MSPVEIEPDKVMEAAADPEERTASGGDPKSCDDCNTTKTPLWRGGPNGPKSLCNACGIRYRKRRRVAMGLDPEAKRKPKRDDAIKAATAEAAEASSTKEEEEEEEEEEVKAGDDTKAGEVKTSSTKKTKTTHTVELHMVGFGKDAVLKQQRRRRQMRRRKPSCLGEEERAAILLMSLSSGVIYA